jgi:hypothetical protein
MPVCRWRFELTVGNTTTTGEKVVANPAAICLYSTEARHDHDRRADD